MTFISEVFTFISDNWLSALVFIGIFSVLIILHELGHFWAARRAGVGVLEFGFGLPPKIWAKKTSRKTSEITEKGEKIEKTEEMEWTLNAIPFGGFVRLEGEDEKSNSPTAFGNRPLGWRILVVCGGVLMNFILGWGLLTIGYGIGMNPLSPSEEQREQYVEEGVFEKKENAIAIIKLSDSEISDQFQLMDIVTKIDNHIISSPEDFNTFFALARSKNKSEVSVEINRFDIQNQKFTSLTRIIPVGNASGFTSLSAQVEIKEVVKNMPAESVGLQVGDIITGVEQGKINTDRQFKKTVKRHFEKGKKKIRISIEREGKNITFIVRLNDFGKMGIFTEDIFSEPQEDKIVLGQDTLYVPVKKVQYSWGEAPLQAYYESVRWMGLSLSMVSNVFTSIVSDYKIPEKVGGPVAIADTTGKLVKHGDWTKILQFAAILSLSLAVVNIMPFPGLDGGRLFFLLSEGILRIFSKGLFFLGLRKKELPTQLPEKYEMPLHAVGYFLLLGLILWITWNDIIRIFG